MIQWLYDLFDNRTFGAARSPQWSEVRREFISKNPMCAVCGTKKKCEVHHQRPFHLHPELELDPNNFITLCRDHHYLFGHLLDWRSYDSDVEVNARIMRDRIHNRPYNEIEV